MKKELVFLLAGGDMRFVHLANLLAEKHTVYVAGLDGAAKLCDCCIPLKEDALPPHRPDYLVLPLPASSDGIYVSTPLYSKKLLLEPFLNLRPKHGVLAGMASGALKDKCSQSGIPLTDYFEREELAVLNSVPTAEGVIQIVLEELPFTIFGQKFLLTGFGRTSKVLAKALLGLGADVTVATRKYEDMAWAKIYGAKSVHINRLESVIDKYAVIVNSVPAKIFTERVLEKIAPESLLIDIASKPGGVDFDTAREYGIKTVWALSLPGKVAPLSAGEIIFDTIGNIISEEE